MIEHLSAKGKSDPRGGLHYFYCPNKIWTPPIGAFGTLKIVKNWIELKKLWAPKVERVKNSKKNLSNTTRLISNHPKNYLYVVLLLLKFKDNLYNFRGCSYNILNHLKWIRNKKIMSFESKRGQNEEKWKNNAICNLKKTYFLYYSFLASYLALHFKDDL